MFMSATALDISRRTGARPSRCALTSQILGTPTVKSFHLNLDRAS
jgi:hypothetical protein